MKYNYNFEALKRNLMDVIKESQIKIGYAKEPIELFYPLDSLNGLLESDLDVKGMSRALQEFADFAQSELGDISVSRDDTRFGIRISEEGVEYVNDKVTDTGFLRMFIEKIGSCNINMDDILAVFNRFSDKVHCEKLNHDDFDYLVYFSDGIPDNFRYCIKFEGDCAIYHRFTPTDYESFHF